jgi:hypothetical protein
MKASDYDRALTAAEVCALLNCPGPSIDALRRYGVIRVSEQVGGLRKLFDRASVEAIIGCWYERLQEAKARQEVAPKKPPREVPADVPEPSLGIMTAAEVSAVLRCSRAYVTLLLQHGILRGEKVYVAATGPAWRIDAESVEEMRGTWRGMLSEAIAKAKAERAARLHNADGGQPRKRCKAPAPRVHLPDAPTVAALALVLRWGLTMRQLRSMIDDGLLRSNDNGDVLEADADAFQKTKLAAWKRDNISGYGRPAAVTLGRQL